MLADDTGHSAVLKEAMSVRMEGDGPVNESPMEVECGLIVEYDGATRSGDGSRVRGDPTP